MLKLVGERNTGKTRELLEYAKENHATVVCSNVDRMRKKAFEYGIVGIDFVKYEDYADFHSSMQDNIVIDDVDEFLLCLGNVLGFSLTK